MPSSLRYPSSNSAPPLAALEQPGNLGMLKHRGELDRFPAWPAPGAASHQRKARALCAEGDLDASPHHCSHRPYQHPWKSIPGSPLP